MLISCAPTYLRAMIGYALGLAIVVAVLILGGVAWLVGVLFL